MRIGVTFIFIPGSSSISCLAISLQKVLSSSGILESSSQYLLVEWAYKAAGVAWVTLVVVTNLKKKMYKLFF